MKTITKAAFNKLKKWDYAGKDQKGTWILVFDPKVGTTFEYVTIIE